MKLPKPAPLPPLDRAVADFGSDPTFAARAPTREQVGRAWAWAIYHKADQSGSPTHPELIAALKKLFPEFRSPRSDSSGSRANK
jgi:hypothetical protein